MKAVFRVVDQFKASATVSGQDRVFEPGDEVVSEVGQLEDVIAIEADQISYLVKRLTFENCCLSNNLGSQIGGPS